jgi:hypothetical protein
MLFYKEVKKIDSYRSPIGLTALDLIQYAGLNRMIEFHVGCIHRFLVKPFLHFHLRFYLPLMILLTVPIVHIRKQTLSNQSGDWLKYLLINLPDLDDLTAFQITLSVYEGIHLYVVNSFLHLYIGTRSILSIKRLRFHPIAWYGLIRYYLIEVSQCDYEISLGQRIK